MTSDRSVADATLPRIVLIDDHELFRRGLAAALEGEMLVVGEANDLTGALAVVERVETDVVVTDLVLGSSSGLDVVRAASARPAKPRILVLSVLATEQHVRQALAAGADGYATKGQTSLEILDAVRLVAAGERYFAPALAAWAEQATADGPLDRIGTLSAREREVFHLAVRGLTNEQIGAELGISVKTVETHRARINRKLGVNSTGTLVRFAALHGLLQD